MPPLTMRTVCASPRDPYEIRPNLGFYQEEGGEGGRADKAPERVREVKGQGEDVYRPRELLPQQVPRIIGVFVTMNALSILGRA